ncbi:hypothetical protein FE840_010420 [Peteryoungia desertarenae]|uniref:Uncharacterized protein n=1 Tax=Peteryoungia desertarenae TaxID=1813451 RepID=A0ABX6QNP1_9HYPH|nr:hypothetical protein [Peteryoungia desertarenae]QLF69916.1 hypothetical protein FE840_010420 [Peteryoungia desertarenae]
MTAILASFAKLTVIAGLMLGPLVAVGMSKTDSLGIEKRGAGLVLFVSLQRNSMS